MDLGQLQAILIPFLVYLSVQFLKANPNWRDGVKKHGPFVLTISSLVFATLEAIVTAASGIPTGDGTPIAFAFASPGAWISTHAGPTISGVMGYLVPSAYAVPVDSLGAVVPNVSAGDFAGAVIGRAVDNWAGANLVFNILNKTVGAYLFGIILPKLLRGSR